MLNNHNHPASPVKEQPEVTTKFLVIFLTMVLFAAVGLLFMLIFDWRFAIGWIFLRLAIMLHTTTPWENL